MLFLTSHLHMPYRYYVFWEFELGRLQQANGVYTWVTRTVWARRARHGYWAASLKLDLF